MFGAESVNAQIPEAETEIVPATARGCRRNTSNIANLKALLGTTKERAFVIAHLGSGETSRDLNRRRLNDIKTEFGQSSSVNPERIIFAEGNKVKGQGRVEFYLGSELMHVTLLARNGDFCALCCDRKKLFYKNNLDKQVNRKRRNQPSF
jgi:hypothetical protein